MRKSNSLQRMLAGLLCAAMVFQSMSVPAFAADLNTTPIVEEIDAETVVEDVAEASSEDAVITPVPVENAEEVIGDAGSEVTDVVTVETTDETAETTDETAEAPAEETENVLGAEEDGFVPPETLPDVEDEEILGVGEEGTETLELGTPVVGYSSVQIPITKAGIDTDGYYVYYKKSGDNVRKYAGESFEKDDSEVYVYDVFDLGTDYSLYIYNGYCKKVVKGPINVKTLTVTKEDLTVSLSTSGYGTLTGNAYATPKSDIDSCSVQFELKNKATGDVFYSGSNTWDNLPSAEYELTAYVKKNDSSDERVCEKSATATPTKAEGVLFDADISKYYNNSSADRLYITLTNISDAAKNKDAYIWYKTADDTKFTMNGRSFNTGSWDSQYIYDYEIEGLKAGVQYTFYIVVDGVAVKKVTTLSEKVTNGITVEHSGNRAFSDYVNIYVPASEYYDYDEEGWVYDWLYVNCDLYKDGKYDGRYDIDYDEKYNYYKDGKKIRRYYGDISSLLPNTSYRLKITVESEHTGSTSVYWYDFETSDVSLKSLKTITGIKDIWVTATATCGTYEAEDNLYVRWTKKGEEFVEIEDTNPACFYSKDGQIYTYIEHLSENTEYTIEVFYYDSEGRPVVIASKDVTTAKDKRIINVEQIEDLDTGFGVVLSVDNDNMNESDSDLAVAYRKKGDERWNTSSVTYFSYDDDVYRFATSSLDVKENDVIEVQIGFLKSGDDVKNMTGVVTKEVTYRGNKKALVKNSEKTYANAHIVNVAVTEQKIEGRNIYSFYKVEGTESWTSGTPVWKNYEGDPDQDDIDVKFSGLETGKTYEYAIGFAKESSASSPDDLNNPITGKFTIKDERAISLTQVNESYYEVSFTGKITGTEYNGTSQQLYLYYREKVEGASWNSPLPVSANKNKESIKFKDYKISGLKYGTTYEYKFAFNSLDINDSANVEKLINPLSGEFTTLADTRKIEAVKVVPGYKKAEFAIDFSGLTSGLSGYRYVYVKEDASTAYLSREYCSASYTDPTAKVTKNGLTPNTKYKYVVTTEYVSDLANVDEIPAEKKITGEFTTKSTDQKLTLSATANNDLTTYNTAIFDVALADATDDVIRAEVTYVDDKNVEAKAYVTLNKRKDYKETLTIEGLAPNKEYKLKSAKFYLYEDGRIDIGEFKPDAPFASVTTKSTGTPSSIKFVYDKVGINLNSYQGDKIWDDDEEDYIYSVQLSPVIEGDNVDRRVIYKSSDEEVAVVYSNGTVVGKKAGTATITATLAGNESAAPATCEVTVREMAVGKLNAETGELDADVFDECNTYKGKSIEGLGLYEHNTETDKWAAISGNTIVTPATSGVVASESPVAEGKATKITGVNTGVTYVDFASENTGVIARIKVTVSAEGKHFAITNLKLRSGEIEAINRSKENAVAFDIPAEPGYRYDVVGAISPKENFNTYNFTWASDKPEVVSVNNGILEVVSAGTAVITVKPKETIGAAYKADEVKFTVNAKKLPKIGYKALYAETHVIKKLEEIKLPDGWKWSAPKTPLYAVENTGAYNFEASYSGDEFFEGTDTVKVYLSTINSIKVEDENHRTVNGGKNVIVVGEDDFASLVVSPDKFLGNISGLKIAYSATCKPETGLSIENKNNGTMVAKATKAGTYKVTVTAKVAEKAIATTTYEIKAVDKQVVDTIKLVAEDKGINKQLKTYNYSGTAVGIEEEDLKKATEKVTYKLTATALGRDGKAIETPAFKWTTSDKTVATITADKTNAGIATLEIKGSGHAMIRVTAQDDAKIYREFALEVKDHKPRIEDKAATINNRLDYENSFGQNIAHGTYGEIEFANVYGESIEWDETKVVKADGSDSEFELIQTNDSAGYGSNLAYYMIKPKRANASVTPGKYSYQLSVKTVYSKDPYTYPITITVVDKPITGKAVLKDTINLFYLPYVGEAEVTLNVTGLNDYFIKSSWEDSSKDNGSEFVFSKTKCTTNDKKKTTTLTYTIDQQKVKVANNKVLTGDDKGTITIKYPGIRDAIVINNVKVKTNYKKANVTALNYRYSDIKKNKAVTNVIPEWDVRSGNVIYYDKTSDKLLYRNNGTKVNYISGAYSKLPDITIKNDYDTSGYYVGKKYRNYDDYGYFSVDYLNYLGNKKSEKTDIVITSPNWRENVIAKHAVKATNASAVMDKLVTLDTKYMNETTASVWVKNVTGITFSDIKVEPDSKASKYVSDNSIEVHKNLNSNNLTVRLNNQKIMQNSIPSGKYGFKVTPSFTKSNGEVITLNTLKFTVNLVTGATTATVKASKTLDLIKQNNNYVTLTPKFKNLPYSSIASTKVELTGEYKDYFQLGSVSSYYNNSLWISNLGYGKLKAGQKYTLNLKYTFTTKEGETFTVIPAKPFVVKPKQSALKFKTDFGKRGSFFAANEYWDWRYYDTMSMFRDVKFSLKLKKGDSYKVRSVHGEVDLNGDGVADIEVDDKEYLHNEEEDYYYWGYVGHELYYDDSTDYCDSFTATVRILDKDAVIASAKGTKVKIPVTVYMSGRDGVAKDSTATVTVNVKR